MKKVGMVFGGLILLLVPVYLLGPRIEVGPPEDYPAPPALAELDDWLAQREAQVEHLMDGAEKSVVWADPTTKARTPVSLVYLHGFSACRQETAPLSDLAAQALGANLYYARLRGHGLHGDDGAGMGRATVEQWMADTLEAFAIGQRLGEKVVVVASSTGATLAVWLADRPEAKADLAGMVLMSPNLGVTDFRAKLVQGPWAREILQLAIGERRQWEPENDARRKWWTWSYPTTALEPMVAIVKGVSEMAPDAVTVPTQVMYSKHDPTVDVGLIAEWIEAHPSRSAYVVDDAHPGGDHVLAGRAMAPHRTERLAGVMTDYIRAQVLQEATK